jgi:RNA polymerase sigma factor (sigma-70 family)
MADNGSFADLIEQAFLSADSNAFDTIYWMLYRYIYNSVQNTTLAEDIAMITMQKVEKNYSRLFDRNKAKSWCFQIARNTTVDELRKCEKSFIISWEDLRRQEGALDASEVVSLLQAADTNEIPEEYALQREVQQQVRWALCQVSPLPRSCLILKFTEKLTLGEIATIHGYDKRTISRYIKSGRQQFQQAYGYLVSQQSKLERSSGR